MSRTATLLILEYACRFYTSQPQPNSDEALAEAYSQYKASNTHTAVTKWFSAPRIHYSILEFTEFILKHRL
jgi:hypothetical protein